MKVLSKLENANLLGQIMAHNDVMIEELVNKPDACQYYMETICNFKGNITILASNPKIDPVLNQPCPCSPTRDPLPLTPQTYKQDTRY